MANLSQELLTNSNNTLITTTYPYYKNINLSYNIDTNNEGKNRQTSKDINGLIQYIELLVNGNNKVRINDKHLGFLYPKYQAITMQTLEDDNINSSESHYLTLVDSYPGSEEKFQQDETLMPGDTIAQLYFASLGILGLFILYRLMEKSR
jgi:hypothetical protein